MPNDINNKYERLISIYILKQITFYELIMIFSTQLCQNNTNLFLVQKCSCKLFIGTALGQ